MNAPSGRLEARVNCDRNIEILRRSKKYVVVGMTVRFARECKGGNKRALAAGLDAWANSRAASTGSASDKWAMGINLLPESLQKSIIQRL
jgi:hypothetical protein